MFHAHLSNLMHYTEFEKIISYCFRKKSLLKKALNHTPSHKNKNSKKNNLENVTLEFIGDAVLELTSRKYLLKKYKNLSIGDISKIKTRMVSDKTLSLFAKKINIDRFVTISEPDQLQRRNTDTILAAAMEAVIGAIFFDSGIENAKKFIRYKIFIPFSRNKNVIHEDYKSIFQEKYQKLYKKHPLYRTVDEKGPPHNKTFTVELTHCGKTLGKGTGKSKKEAEQRAAGKALKIVEVK